MHTYTARDLFLILYTMVKNKNTPFQIAWSNEGIKTSLLEMTDVIFQDYLSNLEKEKEQYEDLLKIFSALLIEQDKVRCYQDRLTVLQQAKEKLEKKFEEGQISAHNFKENNLVKEIRTLDKTRLNLYKSYTNYLAKISGQYREFEKAIQSLDFKIGQLESKRERVLEEWSKSQEFYSELLESQMLQIEQDILSYINDQEQLKSELDNFEHELGLIDALIQDPEQKTLTIEQEYHSDDLCLIQQIQAEIDDCFWSLWLSNETMAQLEEKLNSYTAKDVLKGLTIDRDIKVVKAELLGKTKNLDKRIEMIALMEDLATFLPKDYLSMKDQYLSSF